jgi:hypothetical protein
MSTKSINITVTEQVLRQVNHLATLRNKSVDEMLVAMLEAGVKDTCYRMKRNAQKWQEQKNMKEQMELMKAKLEELGVETEA